MAISRLSLSSLVAAPLKVLFLASLPLLAGLEFGERAAAEPEGITASLSPHIQAPIDLTAEPTFKNALAEGYRALSEDLEDSAAEGNSPSDWADSQYFMLRAMAAARGDDDGPEQLSNWSLSHGNTNPFLQARSEILAAREQMEVGPATITPEALEAIAEAQVSFDCWIERSEERFASKAAKQCRHALQEALARYQNAMIETQ